MGVAKVMCQAPLFSTETLAILGIQLAIVFCLTTTLCENGGTLKMMVRSEDIFVHPIVPHPISEPNHTKV
jgi:hypothetical protein